MALPTSPEARQFYQSARQRFKDASFLLQMGRTTGAVYLAGYSVECMLKALVLSVTPKSGRKTVLESFCGSKAHDYGWLKARYLERQVPGIPSEISKKFSLVNTWSTALRYKAGSVKVSEARSFFKAAEQIINWADGRL
jgi:HEPN domain-containing protein